ncbi:RMD1 family protein [Azotosporobacter soli]|uniref:RMD1 family protein n=1 Tax=Azotosporobacter soli TaxID=3055040 RepID=UPI0031FE72B0
MALASFKAAALTNEIGLNKLAAHFGIDRRFTWEDSLLLTASSLRGILREPADKSVHVYPFGAIVFVNCQHHEIMDLIRYFSQVEKSLAHVQQLDHSDEYEIQVSNQEPPGISNDYLITEAEQPYHRDIVATVLAKSVAVERIEAEVDILVDEIEEIVANLRQGRLSVSDDQLAKVSARILGFKLAAVSYIMLLDKPKITWNNEAANALFDELCTLFELTGRYEIMRHKTEMLMDITQVFADLAHAKRGNRLEWAIIVLIAIEIVLALIEMFVKR